MMTRTNRRQFLKKNAAALAGVAGFPYIVPAPALGADGSVAASDRITLGLIGLGNHGVNRNLKGFLDQPDAQVVALCDLDRNHLRYARDIVAEKYGNRDCATYRDFRDLIARTDLDAVVVSTPDHWHVLPSLAAARAGKDVFCEKPLTLTVEEGRVLCDTVGRYRRVFMTGTGNRSQPFWFHACELVRNGRIGKLETIRARLPGGHAYRAVLANGQVSEERPPPKVHELQPVPEGFDYDMWLGPAPEAPYTPGRCHWNYRWILDYSGGQLTDFGGHIIDISQLANGTEFIGPISVEGQGEFPTGGLYDTATEWELTYEYANGVTLTCTSSESPGVRFEGTDGWIDCVIRTRSARASSPGILESAIAPEEIHLRTCREGEHRDFLNCVKDRRDTYAPAEVGHRTATICHIGNIAMKLGRKLRWDPRTERFTDDEAANRMLSRPLRDPWRL